MPTGVRKGYKGAYRASIMIDGRRISLGNNFKRLEDAKKAYEEAREKHPKKTGVKEFW